MAPEVHALYLLQVGWVDSTVHFPGTTGTVLKKKNPGFREPSNVEEKEVAGG